MPDQETSGPEHGTPAVPDQIPRANLVPGTPPPEALEPESAPAGPQPLRALDALLGIALIWPMELVLILLLAAANALANHAGARGLPDWPGHPVLLVLHSFASGAWTLAVVWLLACRLKRRPLADGLELQPPGRWWLAWSVALGAIMASAGALVSSEWGRQDTMIAKMGSTREGLAFLAVMAVTVAPLCEEVYYRGLVFPALRRSIGAGWAGLIVVGWFMAIHVPQLVGERGFDFASLACVAGAGLVFTVIRHWSDSLLPSITAHLVYNTTLIAISVVSAVPE